jgi:hypothetical protein
MRGRAMLRFALPSIAQPCTALHREGSGIDI